MGRATIKDVARLAGVSDATVSRALHGLDVVAPATRERVERAAAVLNFTLSKSASSLASGRTMRVLLLVSGRLDIWFNASLLQGAYETFSPAGYDVIPAFITNRRELDMFLRALPKERNFDAVIVASFMIDDRFRKAFAALGVPIVGVNNPSVDDFDASVRIDDAAGMDMAVRLLHRLGHRRLAFVGGLVRPDLTYSATLRAQGFLDAARRLGYGEDELYMAPPVPNGDTQSEERNTAIVARWLLDAPQRPTGVCVETDHLAARLVNELRRLGVDVPAGMSVVGFDDDAVAEVCELTTVHQDPIAAGCEAARRALALMRGEPPVLPRHLCLPLELRERRTVAPAPAVGADET